MIQVIIIAILSAATFAHCLTQLLADVANKGPYIGFLILSTMFLFLSVGILVLSNMKEEEK